ncbi:MAG TPA: MFS transporter [Casimicrobiaceae bacterium]
MASSGERATTIRLTRLISALGIAQIISWGTLFYAIAVLGEAMRSELGISATWLFGAFTIGLLISGIVSPAVGGLVDAQGGRFVLSWGSVLGAVALALIASAHGLLLLLLGWSLAGVAMAACLYDPAFATLHQLTGTSYRRAVTALTLFGGFASTVFWPASQWLLDNVGWRETLWIYAGLHLAVCLPLHLGFVPAHAAGAAADADIAVGADAVPGVAPLRRTGGRASYVWLAAAFSVAAFLSATLSAHLIGLLKSAGLTARDAVLVSSLIGPMQVVGRIAEFTFARRLSPLSVGALAFALMTAGLTCLALIDGLSAMAFAFAVLYGWSNGVMTIVRGTVPAVLFGRRNYGALLGRLALPAFVAKAFAPVAFTLVFAASLPRVAPLWSLVLAAVLAQVGYRLATR